jgi:FixJ family two-component response regulator
MNMPPTIFVIDDEETMRGSLEFLLGVQRQRVRTFSSAEAFLAEYLENWEGCLLVDVRMPGMGGVELLEELRRRGIGMPAVLMTGHGSEESLREHMGKYKQVVLEKPFSVDQLNEVIGRRWREFERGRDKRRPIPRG